MTCFLINDAAFFQHFSLTTNFVSKAIMQILEGVHVFELGLSAELFGTATTQRHVTVTTHGTFFHRAIRNADRQIDLTELLHKETRFFWGAQIR